MDMHLLLCCTDKLGERDEGCLRKENFIPFYMGPAEELKKLSNFGCPTS
jgi:hypothetical protein